MGRDIAARTPPKNAGLVIAEQRLQRHGEAGSSYARASQLPSDVPGQRPQSALDDVPESPDSPQGMFELISGLAKL